MAATHMLRGILNVQWYKRISNESLYGDLKRVSNVGAARRMRLAGHCFRHDELPARDLVLWQPNHGVRSRGRRQTTYVDILQKDACVVNDVELATCMMDRVIWRDRVDSRLRST